jgi:hypothetical protein
MKSALQLFMLALLTVPHGWAPLKIPDFPPSGKSTSARHNILLCVDARHCGRCGEVMGCTSRHQCLK